ncbi:MAG: acetoin utilization protein AcuC [Candidatus Krumholzibacteriales bacterium]
MSNAKAAFIYSERLAGYKFSPNHPFKPARAGAVYRMCKRRNLFPPSSAEVVLVEQPRDGVLADFHTGEYIEILKRAGSGREVDARMLFHGIGSMENPVFEGLFDFCALSATATLKAVDMVLEGCDTAFNPCGGFHHARSDRAAGFCYTNDPVLAIKKLKKSGIERIGYVDIDAHHGDGVQDAFYDDPSVLTISTHESGRTLFPWGGFQDEMGEGDGKGYNINVPMEPGTDDNIFKMLFGSIVMDALRIYRPEIIVGVFGADTSRRDPLTHLKMTNNGFIESAEKLHAEFPRIIALGGGGYDSDTVVRSWTLLWVELAGLELEAGYGGAIGGVLMGDSSIDGSDLRDMRSYSSGPERQALLERAEEMIEYYSRNIKPLIEAGG